MSLKGNFIYSTILTFSTYLVPLMVFPYISRILGVDSIGAIDTIDNIIDYCILFSMMGMSTLGIREIAKYKNDKKRLQETFNNLFWLNVISTIVVFFFLIVTTICIPTLQQRIVLLTIGSFKLFANLFWIEWFYRGLEDFKYITIRSVIVRLLFIVSVFVFIKEKSDFTLYYILFVSIVIINAICNWTYKRNKVSLRFKHIALKTYAKPFIILGIFAMLSAIYTKLSIPVLSFTCGDTEAGYYATATRMYQVVIALISSLISVLIPRMSVLIREGNYREISHLFELAFKLLFFISLPIIWYVEFLAPDIIMIFAGSGFEQAAIPMRIVIFQVLIIGSEQIYIMQLLIPLNKDKKVAVAGLCGVITWAILSTILVPLWHGIGTSIVWVATESVVLLIAIYYIKKAMGYHYPWKLFFLSCIESIPYAVIGGSLLLLVDQTYLRAVLITISFIIYSIFLWHKKKILAQ